jgi:hypothetical protein
MVKIYHTVTKVPNGHKINQMAEVHSKPAYNIPTISIPKPSTIYNIDIFG